MFKMFILVLLTLLTQTTIANDDLKVRLTLKDGTVIKGTLLSLDDGVFEVKTASMGNIDVPESQVIGLKYGAELNQPTPAKSTDINQAQLQSMQQNIMNDPAAMDKIMALQQDPEFMKLLQNPEIMAALKSGNVEVLANNPAFVKMMEKSNMQDIVKDYK